ncbi:ABC transporter substrate-binding protein [Bacillus sp. V2I10]|uniref:ABC transporter substrate-binding protein n=1 Tax=Bacillus sp. V2I10 TaxID=3042276 RepID=UPI002785DCA9|nr:ABC transporter substrate-binding protein [Bacillus sp. V2I10]MDQ0858891.1 multiple sugar transport system substrate-binding protein [Bacillus sp. V2I10]
MKIRGKKLGILSMSIFLIFSLVLAACSSEESGASDDGGDAKGTTEITLWHGYTDIGLQALKKMVAAFEEKNPNIKVKMVYTEASEGADQKLLTAVAGGNPPDVALFDRFKVGSWATQDALTDLTDMAAEDGIKGDTYYPYAWEEANYQGKLYGLPYTTDARMLYYNKDHFKAAGLDPENPPKTTKELEEAAEKLTKKEGKRFKQIGFIPWYGQGWLYGWGWSYGGEFYNKETGEVTANDPKIAEALTWMAGVAQKFGVEDIAGFESSAGTGAMDPFISGQISMKVDGNWTISSIEKYKPDLNYGVTPIPTPTGTDFTTWSGGHAIVLPKGAKNVEAAWEFAKYFGSEEGQEVYFAELPGDLSVIPSVNEKLGRGDNKMLKQFTDILPNSHSRPVIPEGQLMWNELVDATENTVRGKGTAQENLDKATEAVNKALEKYK